MKLIRLVLILSLILIPVIANGTLARKIISSGTGFFINDKGYIVTNQHVIDSCKNIYIKGSIPVTPAALVATDPANDLALLKVGFTPRGYARIRPSKTVTPNERVMIIGYPYRKGLFGQYTVGSASIISTEGPAGEKEWLQFSDSASSGNSGGPLIDKNGDVIGVVRAKLEFYQINYLSNRADLNSLSDQEIKKIATQVRASDIAISSQVLEEFLTKNIVDFTTASRRRDEGGYLEDKTSRYIVNVSCELNHE